MIIIVECKESVPKLQNVLKDTWRNTYDLLKSNYYILKNKMENLEE